MGCGASSFEPAEITGGCGCSGTQRSNLNPFRRRRDDSEQDNPSTKQLLHQNDAEQLPENNARPSVSQPRLSVQEEHATPVAESEMQPRLPVMKEVHQLTPSESEKLSEPAAVEEGEDEEKCSGDVEEREVRNDEVADERREDGLMMCPGSPSFRDYICVDRSSFVSSNDRVEVGEGIDDGQDGNKKDSQDQVGSGSKRRHWGLSKKKWRKLGNVYRGQFHRSVKE